MKPLLLTAGAVERFVESHSTEEVLKSIPLPPEMRSHVQHPAGVMFHLALQSLRGRNIIACEARLHDCIDLTATSAPRRRSVEQSKNASHSASSNSEPVSALPAEADSVTPARVSKCPFGFVAGAFSRPIGHATHASKPSDVTATNPTIAVRDSSGISGSEGGCSASTLPQRGQQGDESADESARTADVSSPEVTAVLANLKACAWGMLVRRRTHTVICFESFSDCSTEYLNPCGRAS